MPVEQTTRSESALQDRLVAAVKALLDTVGANGAWSIDAELEELRDAYFLLAEDKKDNRRGN